MPDALAVAATAQARRALRYLCRETGRVTLSTRELATYLQWSPQRTLVALKQAAENGTVGLIGHRHRFYWHPVPSKEDYTDA